MQPTQPVPTNAFPNNNATRPQRSPLKKALLICGGLFAAFIGLCIILAIVSPTDPAKAAKEAALEKESTRALGAYAGQWQGQDGTTIAIRGDGGADFNMGNTTVTGGKATLDTAAKKLKVNGLFGIGREWTVAAAPHAANGATEMTLNNIVYRRSGGFTPSSDSNTPAGNSQTDDDNNTAKGGNADGSAFSQEEAKSLVTRTLLDFNAALQKRDFADFQNTTDAQMQSTLTPEKYQTAFQGMIDQKINIGVIETLTPTFTSGPVVDKDGLLNVAGVYATKPTKVHFDMQYSRVDNAWKLHFLNIKLNND